jgi:hypothetical protein
MGEVGTQALQDRITNVIEIHKEAEDVTKAEVIGVLEIIKLDLYREIAGDDEDGD